MVTVCCGVVEADTITITITTMTEIPQCYPYPRHTLDIKQTRPDHGNVSKDDWGLSRSSITPITICITPITLCTPPMSPKVLPHASPPPEHSHICPCSLPPPFLPHCHIFGHYINFDLIFSTFDSGYKLGEFLQASNHLLCPLPLRPDPPWTVCILVDHISAKALFPSIS